MYDMTKFLSQTFEMKFVDGTILHINPITVADSRKLMSTIEKVNNKNFGEQLLDCVTLIINYNNDNIKYSKEQLSAMLSEELMLDLISNYTRWMNKVVDEKN